MRDYVDREMACFHGLRQAWSPCVAPIRYRCRRVLPAACSGRPGRRRGQPMAGAAAGVSVERSRFDGYVSWTCVFPLVNVMPRLKRRLQGNLRRPWFLKKCKYGCHAMSSGHAYAGAGDDWHGPVAFTGAFLHRRSSMRMSSSNEGWRPSSQQPHCPGSAR